jgi:hypothetical protein
MAKEPATTSFSVKQKKSVSPARATKQVAKKAPSRRTTVKQKADILPTEKGGPQPRRATKRSVAKSAPMESDTGTVLLPKNMSVRAIEKSAVFFEAFEKRFGRSIYQIAYVSAICFMLIGASYTASGFIESQSSLKAELISIMDDGVSVDDSGTGSLDNSETAGPGIAEENIVSIGATEFHFLNSVPSNITDLYAVSFEATNVMHVVPSLTIAGQIAGTQLPVERISENKYKVIIPTKSLTANYYTLRITVKPLDGSSAFVRKTNDFFVGSEAVEKIFNDMVEQTHDDTDVVDDTSHTSTSTGTSDYADATTTTSTSDTPDTEEIISTETTAQPPVELSLITPLSTVLSGVSSIRVKAPDDATYIELYARPVNSISPRFITLATKRLGQWVFAFDSNNIPNGDYEFTARTKYKEKPIISHSIRLTIKNTVVTTAVNATTVTPVVTEERPLLTENEPIDTYTPTQDDDVTRETTLLLMDNETELKALLERYAVAKQTGDETLIRTVQEELQARQEAIILGTLQNEHLRDISDNLNDGLLERIQDLQNRIDTFEEIRKGRSAGATAVDTDSDGVSDIDETKIYGTDPTQADTDNDGVTDGIEIMRGYNPIDSAPEAVIRFESPKETIGLVRDDVLEVKEVIPFWGEESSGKPINVAAEIHGKGLPNSFVTLYIFSTPIVVTVKTDADGVFVYTFDKELEDGQHDIFVAMTDNAGAIIAQSNPFSFIKEAQAFTPLLATGESVISPQPVTENTGGGYSLAIGVGILSFGLILLMLGISLRKGEVVIAEKTLTDAEPTKPE